MARARCLICDSTPLRLFVDNGLNNGLSNAGIAASIADLGGKLDPDVVGRHKNNGHWTKPERTEGPKPTTRDLNIMVRDKVADAVQDMSPEAMLYMKDIAPMVNAGLKAQTALDRAVQHKEKLGVAMYVLDYHAKWYPAPPELEDGMTVEGEAVEVVHD